MPTYQYRCTGCGHSFDIFQKFSEDPLTVCPECEGAIRRVIQPVGIVFKGSGWYITDSRSSSDTGESKAAESNGAGKPEQPAGETKRERTDAKPAAEKKTDKVAAPA